jgi:hypothetical protein
MHGPLNVKLLLFFFFVLGGMVFATAMTYRLVLNIAVLVWCKVMLRNVCGPVNVITLQQKRIHYWWNYLDIESFI